MTVRDQGTAAEILTFPAVKNNAPRHAESRQGALVSLALRRLPGSVSDAWYHEEAMAAERDGAAH